MPEPGDTLERPHARPGRCATHPSAPAISSCAVCRRGLCLSCAIPVRGQVVGQECLSAVVEDLPPQPPPPPPKKPGGDMLALTGFVLVLAVSVFPWSRFGIGSGWGDAWGLHWSIIALASALAGVIVVAFVRRRHLDLRLAAVLYALLAAGIALGAVLHASRPPPLSNAAITLPWRVAIVGAFLALVGAGSDAFAAARAAGRR